MRTITKKVEVPQLQISHDFDSESPREWGNLGYFVTVDSRHNSPDKDAEIIAIVKNTGDEASSLTDHMELIKTIIATQRGENVLAIYPIAKYDHSGVSYSLGQKAGFDYSNNGFYIVTDKTVEELGTNATDFERVIKDELETYNKWCNGEVYYYTLYDSEGDLITTCGGFYDLEAIREELPEEWKNEDLSKYFSA